MNLNTKVSELSGIGPAYVKKLNKIGIENVSDLFFHFPRRYDDFSNILPIAKARAGQCVSVKGNIWQVASKRSKRGVSVLEAVIADESGTIKAVWFNQPFLKNSLKAGDEIVLAGKPEWNFGSIQMQSPAFEIQNQKNKKQNIHTAGIIPVYPETDGLSSKWLRSKIKPLLSLVNEIGEYLPEEISNKYSLLGIQEAIKELHFPTKFDSLEKAKRRIDFEEMFFLQVAVTKLRKEIAKAKAPKIKLDTKFAQEFVKSLGFELTNAQRKAAYEILKDLDRDNPMNRLLEGDVGSGKTVVAAMALAMTSKNNYQAVMIAPTEILAKQHFEGLKELLKEFNLGLLTSGNVILNSIQDLKKIPDQVRNDVKRMTLKEKKQKALELIKNGEVDVVIGTHSLFQEHIEFKNLGLVIIDEQHRFGVEQRALLKKENKAGYTPHFLSMSATPIPRTLTLTVYGDLDVSIIDEMPPGRKAVATRLVEGIKREEANKFIDQKIEEGRQVFVICPMIEESERFELKSVTVESEKLKEIFPKRKIEMLHGKMKPHEKENIMSSFSEGNIDILVSTSVIEVGVNVPNASIMLIEGAERFGLAQLHQFRGRVGRGEHQSYCFLFSETTNEISLKRLHSFVNLSDGFKLAEIDLEIRGPGEVFGRAQHGLPDIKTKNLMNIELIKETRKAAEEFLSECKLDNFPILKDKVVKYDVVKTLE